MATQAATRASSAAPARWVGLRRLAKRVLPAFVVERIQPFTRGRSLRPLTKEQLRELDLSRLELIRSASVADLRDPAFLETELLPSLGLNDEHLHQFPRSLHPHTGQGLYHWQYPKQFAPYLVRLSELEIESYLEIGTRHGGSFLITIEYLSRFRPLRRCVGIDLGIPSAALRSYAAQRPKVTVLQGDSQGREFAKLVRSEGPFDLVLIDGDHSEGGCRADLELVAGHGRILAFHDIVSEPTPGVRKVWADFKRAQAAEYDFFEFTAQYEELVAETGAHFIGIGLAVPRLSRPRVPRADRS